MFEKIQGEPAGAIILNGRGLFPVTRKYNAEEQITFVLKWLLLNADKNNNNIDGNSNIKINLIPPDEDDLFYSAAKMSYDHSQTVQCYFANDTSNIGPENKALWPLCYQVFKEYGF